MFYANKSMGNFYFLIAYGVGKKKSIVCTFFLRNFCSILTSKSSFCFPTDAL